MAASGTAEPDMEKTLETCRDAVNEMAGRSRGLWLSFIALLAYLFITVGAVTHRDLLLQTPVTLPVLNVGLPLTGFFAIAPLFFLINHFYLLLQLKGLSRRIREFNDRLAKAALPQDQADLERRKLDSFVVVQLLGGTDEETSGRTSLFLKSIALITLVLAPLVLLLMIQLQFLAYQSELITWLHRIAILIDVLLLWIFWPAIRTGDWTPVRKPRLMGTAVYGLMFFVCLIATFPGEFADGGPNARDWAKHTDSRGWWIKDKIFGGVIPSEQNSAKLQNGLPGFARTLHLADAFDLLDLDKIEKSVSRHNRRNSNTLLSGAERVASFRNRSLRGAVFTRSDLRLLDLEATKLQGAILSLTNLSGSSLNSAVLTGTYLIATDLSEASLEAADLQEAKLASANLSKASMSRVNLRNSVLDNATLADAKLHEANLQGASFWEANLQRADLHFANLRDAFLNTANLQEASLKQAFLRDAQIKGSFLKGAKLDEAILKQAILDGSYFDAASLIGANLQGASLFGTYLRDAELAYAKLQGASMNLASLQGANLFQANLQGASLENANLHGAILDSANIIGASLKLAKLQGASLIGVDGQVTAFSSADLRGASLNEASLQGAEFDDADLRAASLEGAYLWRVTGKPYLGDGQDISLASAVLSPPNKDWYSEVEDTAFVGIEDDPLREHVGLRLQKLRMPESQFSKLSQQTKSGFVWDKNSIQNLSFLKSTVLTQSLRHVVCEDRLIEAIPYVAKGLIRHKGYFPEDISPRLEEVGPNHLPQLAKYLLDAAEGRRDDCPGVKGLDDASIAKLREWAKPAEETGHEQAAKN